METLYVSDENFTKYIWDAGDKADLQGIDGFTRWVITGENGIKYIVRPESSKKPHEHINTTESA